MDADAVKKMGMSAADVEAMVTAWETNRDTWRAAFVERNLWEVRSILPWVIAIRALYARCIPCPRQSIQWYFFYGGQQTAPGVNQTNPASTCASYLRANCGPNTPPQNATLFYGYSRSLHSKPWPLPWPTEVGADSASKRCGFFRCSSGCWDNIVTSHANARVRRRTSRYFSSRVAPTRSLAMAGLDVFHPMEAIRSLALQNSTLTMACRRRIVPKRAQGSLNEGSETHT